jgi:type VI protein secretion system component Hcp
MHARSSARLAGPILAGVLIATLAPAVAAAATYLKLDGVAGSSANHTGWIEIDSFSMNVTANQRAAGAASGRDNLKEVSVSKRLDSASPALTAAASGARRIANAAIEVTDPAGVVLYRYEFFDVVIVDMKVTNGGDRPLERFTLRFTRDVVERVPRVGPMRAGGSPKVD